MSSESHLPRTKYLKLIIFISINTNSLSYEEHMIIYTSKGKQQIKKGEKENVKSQIGVNKTYYQTTAGLINLQYTRTAIVFAFVFFFFFIFRKSPYCKSMHPTIERFSLITCNSYFAFSFFFFFPLAFSQGRIIAIRCRHIKSEI